MTQLKITREQYFTLLKIFDSVDVLIDNNAITETHGNDIAEQALDRYDLSLDDWGDAYAYYHIEN